MNILELAQKILEKDADVFQALQEYDEGKRDIDTSKLAHLLTTKNAEIENRDQAHKEALLAMVSDTAKSFESRLVHKLQIETSSTEGQSEDYRKGLRDMRYLVMEYCAELASTDFTALIERHFTNKEQSSTINTTS